MFFDLFCLPFFLMRAGFFCGFHPEMERNKMQTKTKNNLKKMTTAAILAAISIEVACFEIPIVPVFPFLKLDFSQVPLILAGMVLGIGPGIGATAICAIISLFITGTASAGVGTAFNFVLGSLFILLYYGAHRLVGSRLRDFLALGIACLLCIVIACFLNYVGVVPLYKLIGMVPDNFDAMYFVIFGALPLNLVKWISNTAIAGGLYQVVGKRFGK